MKQSAGFRTILVILFIVAGWMLAPLIFEWFFTSFDALNIQFASYRMLNQLWQRVVMALIFGLIPVLLWIASRIFRYKKPAFEVIGYALMIGFGVLSLELRARHLVTIFETYALTDFELSVPMINLKINQFLFWGVLVGLLLYLGLGFLFKQLTLKRNYDRQKEMAEQDIGRIGRSED